MDKALMLRAEGDYAILEIEAEKGKWVELIRERLDTPFSHIIEPLGIKGAIDRDTKGIFVDTDALKNIKY